MAILVFILSLLMLIAGAASAYASLDLLPTSLGLLYVLAAAVAACAAILTFAIGITIRRVDGLTKLIRQAIAEAGEAAPQIAPYVGAPVAEGAGGSPVASGPASPAPSDEPSEAEDESPININRTGRLPSLDAIESALETPVPTPSLVGRYSSGGANYMIFADGSIEAETSEGTFRFASMSDFKRHLVERRARQTEQ
jgi:hypothetical protein